MDEILTNALANLPHGPEFRFVDRLLSLEPGKTGVGEYLVRGTEPFLAGHFPGQPLFPGVLLLEAAAQLAGVVAQSDPHIAPLASLKLTGMRAIKLMGSARPGEVLRLEASVTGRLANLVQVSVSAQVGGHVVLRGELTLGGDTLRADSR